MWTLNLGRRESLRNTGNNDFGALQVQVLVQLYELAPLRVLLVARVSSAQLCNGCTHTLTLACVVHAQLSSHLCSLLWRVLHCYSYHLTVIMRMFGELVQNYY